MQAIIYTCIPAAGHEFAKLIDEVLQLSVVIGGLHEEPLLAEIEHDVFRFIICIQGGEPQ